MHGFHLFSPALAALFQVILIDIAMAGDNAIVHPIYPGMTLWPLIPSGQNITQGDQLQSNGDGRVKEATSIAASAGVAAADRGGS